MIAFYLWDSLFVKWVFCKSFSTNYFKFWLETYSTNPLIWLFKHPSSCNTSLSFCTPPLLNHHLIFFDCIKSLCVNILLPWKMYPFYYDAVLFFTSCTCLLFVAGLAAALLLRTPDASSAPWCSVLQQGQVCWTVVICTWFKVEIKVTGHWDLFQSRCRWPLNFLWCVMKISLRNFLFFLVQTLKLWNCHKALVLKHNIRKIKGKRGIELEAVTYPVNRIK